MLLLFISINLIISIILVLVFKNSKSYFIRRIKDDLNTLKSKKITILEKIFLSICFINYDFGDFIQNYIKSRYKMKNIFYHNEIDILTIFYIIISTFIIVISSQFDSSSIIASYFLWRIVNIALNKLMIILEIGIPIKDYSHSFTRNIIFTFIAIFELTLALTYLYNYFGVISNINYDTIFITFNSFIQFSSNNLNTSCCEQKSIILASRFIAIIIIVMFITNSINIHRKNKRNNHVA